MIVRVTSLTLLVGLLTMCGGGCAPSAAKSGKPMVVATTGMVGDLVRRVAGDTVELQELMGPGVDPHLYKPTGADRRKLDQANIIFYNGLHLEGNMATLLEENSKAKAVTQKIPRDTLLKEADQADPHVWFDVSLWAMALDVVEKELSGVQPTHAAQYEKNASEYRKELQALHEEVRGDLAKIPKPQRVMVTAHDAFRYFGRAYDMEVHGLQGISTAGETGLKEVQAVVDLLSKRGIKAIFVESSVPADRVQAVVEQCKARGHAVQVASEQLLSDAMGDSGTPAGTYPGMIRHNVRVIVNALK